MGKVVIPLFDAFDIETYDGLIGFIEAYLELDAETVAQLPTLIRLAEYRLDRMLTVPQREFSTDLTTEAGTQFVALPVHTRQFRAVRLDTDPQVALEAVGLDHLNRWYDGSGQPKVYAFANESLYFGPTPDAAYTVNVTYMTRIPPLSPTNQTNWLLSQHADAYVYAVLVQAEGFIGDDARIAMFKAALDETILEINAQGNRYRNAGPIRLRSSVVV